MKVVKIKKGDASMKPYMRTKVFSNVFVEIYRDNKGFFYKIVVPGITEFISKDHFTDQMRAENAGVAHAKRTKNQLMKKDKGEQSIARVSALLSMITDVAKGLDSLGTVFQKEKIKGTSEAETVRVHLAKIQGGLDAIRSKIEKLDKAI